MAQPHKGPREQIKTRVHAEVYAALRDLAGLRVDRDALVKRVQSLESRPAPGGPALRSVAKGEDLSLSREEDELNKIAAIEDRQQQSLALIKLSQRKPQIVRF